MNGKSGTPLIILLCLALFLPSPALATEMPASLQNLILLGLRENLGLKASRFSVATAREEIDAAAGEFDVEFFSDAGYVRQRTPNSSGLISQDSFDYRSLSGDLGLRKRFGSGLSGTLSFNTIKSEDSSLVESLDPKYQATLGLELRQPLLRDAGADVNFLSVNLARGGSRQAEFTFLQQAQNLALAVEVGFYDLIKAYLEENFRREARDLTQILLQGNRRKLDTGLIPLSEVQEAETALAGGDLDYVLARQEREVRTHRLKGLLNNQLPEGLENSSALASALGDLPLPGRPWVPNLPEALEMAEKSRPDLLIADIEIAQLQRREKAAENRQLPRLDLNLQLQASGLSGEEPVPGSIPYAGDWGDSLASLSSADGYLWGAGLQFSYPLGNNTARAGYRKARQQSAQGRLNRRDLLIRIETEIRERLTQVERLGELVGISSRFQELAEISYRQETRRLEEGLSDTFRVLSFQEKMINAKVNRVAALVEYNKGLASLSYAMGSNLLRHGIVANLSSEEIPFDEN